MSFDISRLQTQLNNTGLQNKNTPLYQFLNQLLNNLKNIDNNVTNVINNPTASITNLTQILQSIALGDDNSGDNNDNDLFVPGSQSGSAQNISILFSGEVPTGLINSSNKLFTTVHTYLTGFLAPYLNGVRQLITEDYTETSPTTFTFVNAPITGDIVLVDYVQVAGVSGVGGATGAAGADGTNGATGAQGPVGLTILVEDGLDGQDGFSIPGSGNSGGSAGALVLLEQHTAAASASLDFTTAITSLYDDYLIELLNIVPATSVAELWMRISTDSGSTFAITNYQYEVRYTGTGSQTGILASASATHILLTSGGATTANEGVVASIKFYNPSGAGSKRIIFHASVLGSDGVYYDQQGMGLWSSSSAVNALEFL